MLSQEEGCPSFPVETFLQEQPEAAAPGAEATDQPSLKGTISTELGFGRVHYGRGAYSRAVIGDLSEPTPRVVRADRQAHRRAA